jgi:hypothetical protein
MQLMSYAFPKKLKNHVIFEVFTTVKMMILFSWVLEPCRLEGGCQRFGGTYCLHLQPTYESTGRQNPEE